jgi:tRNA A-37 threonylcarbamoyl transferase component Bud32/tetratricopeptide (TPR) repeat protein
MLRLIGTDLISEATFADLESHVEQCDDCQKILDAAIQSGPPVTAPPAPPVLPGLTLERELGRGGTSRVYLAWEPALSRHVAVKLFPKNPHVDPHAREHWLAEARALTRVSHDQVVTIHRVDENNDWLWLVLEFVPGGTLKPRLTEPLPPRVAARLAETIARTVAYFHSRGVVHLDLKPSNILLGGQPGEPWDLVSPKISDFGIARLEGEPGATETGANGPKGTPSYMAPEQVAAVPGTIGPAADIYALGALLYHLLTGRPPFQGASSAETFDQVRNQDSVPPRRLNGRIPRDLETICLKCLERAPNRRYRTADALADDLRLWLDGRPIGTRRVSPAGHAWRLCRRHPLVAGLLVSLGLTLTTGVVGLVVLLGNAKVKSEKIEESLRRAEAYEKFSANTADHLTFFLGELFPRRRDATPEEIRAALLKLRSSIADLKRQGVPPSPSLAVFEHKIGTSLMKSNMPQEARDLLNQAAVDLTESLTKDPRNGEVRHFLTRAHFFSGTLAEVADEPSVALNCFQHALDVESVNENTHSDKELLTHVYNHLRFLADRLDDLGQTGGKDQAQRLGERILERLIGPGVHNRNGSLSIPPETIQKLFQILDVQKMFLVEDRSVRDDYRLYASEWIAASLDSISPFRSCSAAETYDQDPEAGASALIAACRDLCLKTNLPDTFVANAIDGLTNDAILLGVRQRGLGQVDQARATAARLLSLASRAVREYPGDASSYAALSNAYNQIRKNAMRGTNDELVENSTVQAIEAGKRALALNPDDAGTRETLDKLTTLLPSIKADRNAKLRSKTMTLKQ